MPFGSASSFTDQPATATIAKARCQPLVGMLRVAGVVLAMLPAAATGAEPQWLEDPGVLDHLRNQLVDTLGRSGKGYKTERAGRNDLRVTGKRLRWRNQQARKPADVLAPVLTEASARDKARADRIARTPPERIHWTHSGERGESHWPELHPTFTLCRDGHRQSPISIDYAIHVNLPPFALTYGAGPFLTIDDGKGLSARLHSQLQLNHRGTDYRLRHVKFHRPAEHAVNGQRADMSAHLVHQGADGQILILAVSMNIGDAANVAVQRVLDAFPLEPGQAVTANAPLDPNHLIPSDQRYYEYLGSLTQPPCTEGVRWLMLRQPISISAAQYEVFASLYAPNARSLQAHNRRRIKMSR